MTGATRTVTIEKTLAESWLVSDGFDHAQIFIRHGRHGTNNHWVSVSIMSSFGNWGYHWNACGPRDWLHFLAGITRDYAMGKFMGPAHYQDDVDETVKHAKQQVLEMRRAEDLSKAEAQEAWDTLIEHECDPMDRLIEALSGTVAFRDSYWELPRSIESPAAIQFWRQLWEPWIAAIKSS